MGLMDKLKGLQQQAQTTVAEHRDEIQNAVDSVGAAANNKTQGKYSDKITKVGATVSETVDKIASGAPPAQGSTGDQEAAPTDQATAPTDPTDPTEPEAAGSAEQTRAEDDGNNPPPYFA